MLMLRIDVSECKHKQKGATFVTMRVEITNGRLLITDTSGASAYEGVDLVSATIGQEVINGTWPLSGRTKATYPAGRSTFLVNVATSAGGAIVLRMGTVENQPDWTNTHEGAARCVGDITEVLQGKQCCAQAGEGINVEVNGVPYATYTESPAKVRVEQEGAEVGSLIGPVWVIPPCKATPVEPMDINIYLDSVLMDTITGVDPAVDNTLNITLA